MSWRVILGDCIEVMAEMDEASVDAIVTDPPYGLEFMGKEWDSFRVDDPGTTRHRGEHAGVHGEAGPGDGSHPSRSGVAVAFGGGKRPSTYRCTGCGKRDQFRNDHTCTGGRWARELIDPHAAPPTLLAFGEWCRLWALEAYRVLKPGGHLLSFGGTRTYHRLTVGLEDAGFEIRDCLAWLYGSGFPKSLDVSKAIDKAAGAERDQRVDERWIERYPKGPKGGEPSPMVRQAARANDGPLLTSDAATPDAERWQGWGTGLKPAFEPIVLARKPLAERSVAANVLEHGTGALNIDGARIEHANGADLATSQAKNPGRDDLVTSEVYGAGRPQQSVNDAGRWPANVLLDPETAAMLDEQSGDTKDKRGPYVQPPAADYHNDRTVQGFRKEGDRPFHIGDSGGASRFFYTAKTSRAERELGRQYAEDQSTKRRAGLAGADRDGELDGLSERWRARPTHNDHPTVKPVDLMQWLCRLVTLPGGTVLDPFTGSGSTGMAALREGFSFIGIEREPEYVEIARARIIGDGPLFAIGEEVTA